MIKDFLIYYTRSNIIRGILIYSAGDTIACLLTGSFDIFRLIGIAVIGGFLYSLEIPLYFIWIFNKIPDTSRFLDKVKRGLLAMAYFNPLWVSRHLFLIHLASGNFENLNSNLLKIGLISFLYNVPFSFIANIIIQNYIPLKHKFIASAVFSGLMAIYYSLSEVLFE